MIDRSYIVGVRLTKQEHQYLTEKAMEDSETLYRNGKKNLSGYIRKCALAESGKSKISLIKEFKRTSYQIRKIGVNINQVAKKINAGYGYSDPMIAVEELKKELEQMPVPIMSEQKPLLLLPSVKMLPKLTALLLLPTTFRKICVSCSSCPHFAMSILPLLPL